MLRRPGAPAEAGATTRASRRRCDALREAARGGDNLVPRILDCRRGLRHGRRDLRGARDGVRPVPAPGGQRMNAPEPRRRWSSRPAPRRHRRAVDRGRARPRRAARPRATRSSTSPDQKVNVLVMLRRLPAHRARRAGRRGLARLELPRQARRRPAPPGLIRVDDLDAQLARLRGAGVRLIDEAPRPARTARASPSCTRRSTGGVLVELVEDPPPAERPVPRDAAMTQETPLERLRACARPSLARRRRRAHRRRSTRRAS